MFICFILAMGKAFMAESEIETKIKELLVDYFHCNPTSIVIDPLRDGVVNCYNNFNYKITIDGKSYFAKFENQNGKLLQTSLHNDIVCRTLASERGISPKILLSDPQETLMITDFLKVEEIDFKKRATLQRYVALLQQLHKSDCVFPLEFCAFQTIRDYMRSAQNAGVIFPEILLNVILPTIEAFDKSAIFLNRAPCHLDPQVGNLLDDGTTMYLIDWECAAMCDPLFDLASMCATEEFTDEEMREVLNLYLDEPASEKEFRRFYQMRILADMRFGIYCYLQNQISPTRKELYKSFAEGYLHRITERLENLSKAADKSV